MELKTDNKLIWPAAIQDIKYTSKADNSLQPMYFYCPEDCGKVPLLVYLHPWSTDYRRDDGSVYVRWCVENNWAIIIPDFRGPNIQPEACGSELVVADINSAVDYAQNNAVIDPERIYLVGVSGGGYASLLMAGRRPAIWAGVSAWVPIYDLKDWHKYCGSRSYGYTAQIEKVCGGIPGASPEVDEQYKLRSASTWLPKAKNVIIEISGGIHDLTIPVSHTLRAFNALAKPEDCISQKDIEHIDKEKKLPEHLKMEVKDSHYENKVLFRRESNNARVTIFDGGHEIIAEAALKFLSKQKKVN